MSFSIFAFFAQILSIGLVVLGIFIVYLIIRTAINNSKLNQNVEALRGEIRELNQLLRSQNSNDDLV